ncbi:6-pyruvoyl trahydropterin synthase family protein [Amycolatopsis sp. H20-H5]|uniref:6-pyruvoyl trahydropterin synthase family protein n=1 Tax=Amycolatopsis sp. H20-H5 TaxID=3046309 RepID=UPI002DB81832|nr:6-carboxytetrahydropterin synthase [Amycolatopsis sp. H20-H5]MEC3978915.1 6-carboxytetrahydropterin synthase [Amycolatopsis sp. H20-H5]
MSPHPASSTRVAVSDLARGRYCIGDGSFSFAAAHHLADLPDFENKAGRPHGHTFTVEVELIDAELRAPGFVADYAELAPVGEYLKRELDHRDLNALFTFDTTTDALAQHITAWFLAHMPPERGKQLHAIHVGLSSATGAHQHVDDESFTFEAAHHLEGLPDGHKCGRPHGHSYRVDLRLDPQTNPRRRARLRSLLAVYLDRHLDYRDLNAVLAFQPTSELLAEHLYACILDQASTRDAAAVLAVRVWESPRRWAEFAQDERSGR